VAAAKKEIAQKDPGMQGFRKLLFLILLAMPSLGAAVWTVLPALSAVKAVGSFPSLNYKDVDIRDEKKFHELRRTIQKHFRDGGLYIPLEDIVAGIRAPDAPKKTAIIMQKACGRGKIHVWIPLQFRLPLIGSKVVDWCWNASAKLI
jgi:hypothetical protein